MKIYYFLALFLLTIFTSNLNFTSAQDACLVGQVYCDVDNSGNFNLGDIPLDSVPMILNSPSLSHVDTTLSNFNGNYNFIQYPGIWGQSSTIAIDSTWLSTNGFYVNNNPVSFINAICSSPQQTNIINFPILGCGTVQPPSNMCLLGQVYCDIDSSGTFTLGDIPLDSVPLILNSSQGQLSALSNPTGNYNFTYQGTAGQNSTVAIDSGWLSANGYSTNINPVSFNDSACINTPIGIPGANIINFPILGCGTVQPPSNMCLLGLVYCDVDSNGTFTPGDIPLDSVPLTLNSTQGQLSALSNPTGNYNFTYPGTPGQSSTIAIDSVWLASNGYSTNSSSVTFNDSACINTPIGAPGINIIDFPILGCSTFPPQIDMCISGVIYCDLDLNGVFSMGDIPIDSVPVSVITPQGSILNTFTDANGLYSFIYQGTAGLPSIVNIDPIWLATNGYSGNPVSNAINTPCLLGGVVIDFPLNGCNQGQNNMCLSGQVFCDLDSNGIFNSGDTPLDSVPVSLNLGFSGTMSAITDQNGFYSFTYQANMPSVGIVSIDPNWLLNNGYSSLGSNPQTVVDVPCSSASGGSIANFPINCNTNNPNPNNMCLIGWVFCDVDSNGVLNPAIDLSLAQVPVTISFITAPSINLTTDITGQFNAVYQGVPGGAFTASIDNAWLTTNGYTSNSVSAGNSSCMNPPLNIDLPVYGCVSAGINEQEIKVIKIYPNPFKNILNISASEEISSIQMIDLSGRLLVDKKITSEFTSQINISNIISGNYILIIKTTSGIYEEMILKR